MDNQVTTGTTEGYRYVDTRKPLKGDLFWDDETKGAFSAGLYEAQGDFQIFEYDIYEPIPVLIDAFVSTVVDIEVLGQTITVDEALTLRNVLNGLPLDELALLEAIEAAEADCACGDPGDCDDCTALCTVELDGSGVADVLRPDAFEAPTFYTTRDGDIDVTGNDDFGV